MPAVQLPAAVPLLPALLVPDDPRRELWSPALLEHGVFPWHIERFRASELRDLFDMRTARVDQARMRAQQTQSAASGAAPRTVQEYRAAQAAANAESA